MRTAEEVVNRIVLTGFDFPDAVNLIKEYAKEVAEQALKDAYINSELEYTPSRYPYGGDTVTIDKDSIVNTPIITP